MRRTSLVESGGKSEKRKAGDTTIYKQIIWKSLHKQPSCRVAAELIALYGVIIYWSRRWPTWEQRQSPGEVLCSCTFLPGITQVLCRQRGVRVNHIRDMRFEGGWSLFLPLTTDPSSWSRVAPLHSAIWLCVRTPKGRVISFSLHNKHARAGPVCRLWCLCYSPIYDLSMQQTLRFFMSKDRRTLVRVVGRVSTLQLALFAVEVFRFAHKGLTHCWPFSGFCCFEYNQSIQST